MTPIEQIIEGLEETKLRQHDAYMAYAKEQSEDNMIAVMRANDVVDDAFRSALSKLEAEVIEKYENRVHWHYHSFNKEKSCTRLYYAFQKARADLSIPRR